MKTNKIMLRRMGEFEVTQRTKDGYFSATKLMSQWNKSRGMKKEISDFLKLESTKSFIETIKEDSVLHTGDSPYVKSRASRGENSGTWMHPYLFIDFAMWINPTFKLQVIKFVHDQLIEFRHDAGDNYRELCSAAQRLQDCNYPTLARSLNYVVFNTHQKELRQNATEKQLRDLQNIQKHLAFSVNTGLINSFDDLIQHLRKMWHLKWNGGI